MAKVYEIELPDDDKLRWRIYKLIKDFKGADSRGRTLVFLEDLTKNGPQELETKQLYEVYGSGFTKYTIKNLMNANIIVRIKLTHKLYRYEFSDEVDKTRIISVTETKGEPDIDEYRRKRNED